MRINRLADVLCIALLTDYYNRSMLVKAVKNSSREDDLKKKIPYISSYFIKNPSGDILTDRQLS